MGVVGCPVGSWLGGALVKGSDETEGSSETLGMELTDGALEVVDRPDGIEDGSVDTEGTSEGALVEMLDVEGAEDTEGASEMVGLTLVGGALEIDGRSDGAEEGWLDTEGTSASTRRKARAKRSAWS